MSANSMDEEVHTTEKFTASDILTILTAIATATVLFVNAWEKITAVIHAVKAPDDAQNDRLAALEADMERVKQFLANDKSAIEGLTEGDKVTKHAILALLGHGIDGNNKEEMIKSKRELESYLINR